MQKSCGFCHELIFLHDPFRISFSFFSFCLQAGVDAERLEQICRKTGLAVGVVTLSDEVGIDVGLHVTETLTEAFRERYGRVCGVEIANEFVAENMLGKKISRESVSAGYHLNINV